MARLDQKNMWVGLPTWERMTVLKDSMKRGKGRDVTYSEVIEYLLDYAEIPTEARP